jgi:hypothetical protein
MDLVPRVDESGWDALHAEPREALRHMDLHDGNVRLEATELAHVEPDELAAWHLLHPFSDVARDLGMLGREAGAAPHAALREAWTA